MKSAELEMFCYNIKEIRRHYGIPKKKMAELLGIGVGSLNQIEQGVIPSRLTVEILFAVQKQFKITPDVLLSVPIESSFFIKIQR